MIRLTAVALLFVIALSACAGPTIERLSPTTTAPSSAPKDVGPSETTQATRTTDAATTMSTSEATTTTGATTTTETTDEGGTLDSALAVGDASVSGFAYDDFGASWEGAAFGLVEMGMHEWNDEEGRCLVLVGTLTPTAIEDGAVTNGFQTPRVSMIVDGGLVEDQVNECDTAELEDAGDGWILNAEVTEGTVYPFYTEFFIPSEASELEVVVVGNPSGVEALYEPTILDTIPELTPTGTT